jgi:hypothetical protein
MTEQTPNPLAKIGGNAPPIADQMALAYEQLEQDVTEALATARDDLPPTIENDEDVGLVANYVKQIVKPLRSRIDAAEELEKRPLMNATDAVRGFFRGKSERLDKALAVLNKRVKSYQDAVAAQKRAEAAEAARKLREQQAAVAAQAEAERIAGQRKAAELAQAEAQKLAIQAQSQEAASTAKGADHARVKTSDGATATVQTFWTHEVLDLQAIPPAILWPFISDQAKHAAIVAFVKAGNRELAGVRIYEDTRPTYR